MSTKKTLFKPQDFAPELFIATPWATAQDKSRGVRQVAEFLLQPTYENFTQPVYHTLYQYLYGHIAHYDRDGFWDEWFATEQQYVAWVEQAIATVGRWVPPELDSVEEIKAWIASKGGYRQADRSWKDAELALTRWIINNLIEWVDVSDN